MAKLTLNDAQTTLINRLDISLEQVFKDGVQGTVSIPLIKPIDGYIDGQYLTKDDRDGIKGSYMGPFAAFLSELNGTDWTVPLVMTLGWYPFIDASYHTVQYKRDGLGSVKIRGLVGKTPAIVSQSNIFTLPTGFRPSKSLVFPAVSSAGLHCEVRVHSTGIVEAVSGDFGAGTSWWSLNFEFEVI